jgi:transcriptional regulator with XRE-family HTH domain
MVDLLELLKSDKPNLPNKFTTALGELIRKARIEANLSQKDLAWKAYINQAGISLIESGKRSVSAEEIVYLSVALNKPIQYFFSMDFLNPVNEKSLSILEQELLINVRNLSDNDLKRIIAQVKALAALQ